ncbi:hypothetical protein LguiA_022460 [Lonicera macranthoides]
MQVLLTNRFLRLLRIGIFKDAIINESSPNLPDSSHIILDLRDQLLDYWLHNAHGGDPGKLNVCNDLHLAYLHQGLQLKVHHQRMTKDD